MEKSLHSRKKMNWKLFWIGLGVRLFGVLLIWLGDGHPDIFRKILVVLGVIISIGGITILKYLLMAEPVSQLSKWMKKKHG